MKNFLILAFCVAVQNLIFCQENELFGEKEQKKLAKEQKLAQRAAESAEAAAFTDSLLKSRRFVLEADYISGRTGERYMVSSLLNFISVDSLEAVMQLGSPWGLGVNGVGGITVYGTISKYEIKRRETKKSVSFFLKIYIFSNMGSYDIQLWVSENGNADATVRGTASGSLSYSGKLVPGSLSRVYKGHSYP